MKVKVNYEGKEILVDEKVKDYLETAKRKEDNRARGNRRHEVLWDATLVEGMDAAREMAEKRESVEDKVSYMDTVEKLKEVMSSLNEFEQQLITDRFVHQLKYRELTEKYGLASSTIESKIKKVLLHMKKEMMK